MTDETHITQSRPQPFSKRLPGLRPARLKSLFKASTLLSAGSAHTSVSSWTPGAVLQQGPTVQAADRDSSHSSFRTGPAGQQKKLCLSELGTLIQQQLVTVPGARFATLAKESAKDRIQPFKTLARLRNISHADMDAVQVSELLPHLELLIQHWKTDRTAATARKNLVKHGCCPCQTCVRRRRAHSSMQTSKPWCRQRKQLRWQQRLPLLPTGSQRWSLQTCWQAAKQDAAAAKATAAAKRKAAGKPRSATAKRRTAGDTSSPLTRFQEERPLQPLQPLPGAVNPSTLLVSNPSASQPMATCSPAQPYPAGLSTAAASLHASSACIDQENLPPSAQVSAPMMVSTHGTQHAPVSCTTGAAPCKPVDPRLRWLQAVQHKQQMRGRHRYRWELQQPRQHRVQLAILQRLRLVQQQAAAQQQPVCTTAPTQ